MYAEEDDEEDDLFGEDDLGFDDIDEEDDEDVDDLDEDVDDDDSTTGRRLSVALSTARAPWPCGYCSPERASRTSVTASGKTSAITARIC